MSQMLSLTNNSDNSDFEVNHNQLNKQFENK